MHRRIFLIVFLFAASGCHRASLKVASPAGVSTINDRERPFSSDVTVVNAPSSQFERCTQRNRGLDPQTITQICTDEVLATHNARMDPCRPFWNGWYWSYPASYDPQCAGR